MPAFVAHPVSLVEDDIAEQLEDGIILDGKGADDDGSIAREENKTHRGRGDVKAQEPLGDRKWDLGPLSVTASNVQTAAETVGKKDDSASAEAQSKETILERFKSGWRSKQVEPKVQQRKDREWDKSWPDWKDDQWSGWPDSNKDGDYNALGDKSDGPNESVENVIERLPCAHPRCNFVVHSLKAVSDRFCCKCCEASCDALEPAEHDGMCEGAVIGSEAAAERVAEREGASSTVGGRPAARGGQDGVADAGSGGRSSVSGLEAQRTSRTGHSSQLNPVDSELEKQFESRRSGRRSRSLSKSKAAQTSTQNVCPYSNSIQNQVRGKKGRPPDVQGHGIELSSGHREGAKGRDGTGHRAGNDWDRSNSRDRRHVRKGNAMQDRPGSHREKEKRRGSAKGRDGGRDEPMSGNSSSSRSVSARGPRSGGQITPARGSAPKRAPKASNALEHRDDFASGCDRDRGRGVKAGERDLRELALRERALQQLEPQKGQHSKRKRARSISWSEDGSHLGAWCGAPPSTSRRSRDTHPENLRQASRAGSRRERELRDDSADSLGSFRDSSRGREARKRPRLARQRPRATREPPSRSGSQSPVASGRGRGRQEDAVFSDSRRA